MHTPGRLPSLPLLRAAGAAVLLAAAGAASLRAAAPEPDAALQASGAKHARQELAALKTLAPPLRAQLEPVLADHMIALETWHRAHDARIHALWEDFARARSAEDEAAADRALDEIDAVYAGFRPEHDRWLARLNALLAPAQVAAIEDQMTAHKVEVTYRAYQQIFPGLKPAENAFILRSLEAARNQAVDAQSMHEKSDFFKKYKIRIEAYLTAQGYDVRASYKAFGARLRAEMAAKKRKDSQP
jgi:Protein of unknown function (DUF3826)